MTETTAPFEPKPLGDGYFQDPLSVFARMREGSPVTSVITPEGQRAWLITRYEDVRKALADPRLSKDWRKLRSPGFVPDPSVGFLMAHMLNADPPDHTRLRRLVQKAFTPGRVAGLRPRIEAITTSLLDAMAGGGSGGGGRAREADPAGDGVIDLITEFAFPLPMTVICELLGIPDGDREEFKTWSQVILSSTATFDEYRAAGGAMYAYFTRLLADKRAAPADDLLSALITARDSGDSLDEPELLAMIFLLLVAGHETTVGLISNAVLALLRHPDQLAAQDEDLQVGGGLADGEELVHGVELGEPALSPGPGQLGGRGEGGDGARRRDLERLPEPDLVVRKQLVHPCVGGVADRPVRGQQPSVGQCEHQPQRPQVLAERLPGDRRLEADRRGDVRQHVVPGEQQGGRLIVEHDVTAGVPGSVDRAQRARRQVDHRAVAQPAVRVVPLQRRLRVRQPRGDDRPHLRGELGRAERGQHLDEPWLVVPVGDVPDRHQVVPLPLAQRDQLAQRAPQLDREGVVVLVNMGDEEVPDVGQAVAELAECLGETFARLDDRHPRVDQVDAVLAGDRVHVDRGQPVVRQRQRYPVQATAEVFHPGLGPGAPVIGGRPPARHVIHGWVPPAANVLGSREPVITRAARPRARRPPGPGSRTPPGRSGSPGSPGPGRPGPPSRPPPPPPTTA